VKRRVLAGIAVTAAALSVALGSAGTGTAGPAVQSPQQAAAPLVKASTPPTLEGGGLCCYE
jgi:hypothetical protein